MKFKKLVPDFIKTIATEVQYSIQKMQHSPKNRDELHEYWKQPYDNTNLPEEYLEESEYKKSRFLLETINQYTETSPSSKILEIGCNAGRNLDFLFRSGLKDLEAIEISEKAVQVLTQNFPQMASQIKIYNQPVEVVIKELKDSEYDFVFTMAVLEHIHTDSEQIFSEMVSTTTPVI